MKKKQQDWVQQVEFKEWDRVADVSVWLSDEARKRRDEILRDAKRLFMLRSKGGYAFNFHKVANGFGLNKAAQNTLEQALLNGVKWDNGIESMVTLGFLAEMFRKNVKKMNDNII